MKTQILDNKIRFHSVYDEKFKNFRAGIYVNTPLTRENAVKNTLLARMLMSGNSVYKDKKQLNLRLEQLCGSSLSASVTKRGEAHILNLVIDCISDSFSGKQNFSDAVDLLFTTFLSPNIENNAFDQAVFEREKKNLADEIQGVINNKTSYAMLRCAEIMCKDEAFGIRKYGYIEDLQKITPQSLYEHYLNLLKNNPVDILVVGNADMDFIADKAKKAFDGYSFVQRDYAKTSILTSSKEKYVEDNENVIQGKLVMGYRINCDISEEGYYPMLVFNAMFGAGTTSKLFVNVREKESLCYYASSRIERTKSLMFVQSGIEFSNYDKAVAGIKREFENMQKGDFTDFEFTSAKLSIENSYLSYNDSISHLCEYYADKLSRTPVSLQEAIEKIKAVTKEEVIKAANSITLDTVYFLNGGKA